MNAYTQLDRRSFGLALLLLAPFSACQSSEGSSKKSKSDDEDDGDDDGSKKKSGNQKKKKGSSSAATEETSKPARDLLAGFVKYTSIRGKYEIMFPTKPTEKISDPEPPVSYQVSSSIDPKRGYTAGHSDFAEVRDAAKDLTEQAKKNALETACGGLAKKMNGTNERRKAVTVEGNEGCEVEFYTKEFGVMRARNFWVGMRSINLITMGVTAVESEAFFASFKTMK